MAEAAASEGAAALQAIEQRALIAEATRNALVSEGWTVTMIDGGAADRYTGIEATRGTEHLLAAVGADELIADQAGAHDCAATVRGDRRRAAGDRRDPDRHRRRSARRAGRHLVRRSRAGRRRAHAIAATLRRAAAPARRRRAAPSTLRTTTGNR